MKINEYNDGLRIIEKLLVSNMTKGVTNAGQAYLSVTLQDNTGQIEAKVWDASDHDVNTFQEGNIVEINADVIEYRNKLQLKIITARQVDISKVSLNEFTLSSPVKLDFMKEELERLIESLENKDIYKIVRTIIDRHYDSILVYPAAAKLHHAYTHGLLEHTITLANIADKIIAYYLELYDGKWLINRDLVIGGILLHDVGKTIELSGPVLTKYTLEGKLLGHISLLHAEVLNTAKELKIDGEMPTLLAHIVLSHHGKLEFGSPVLPLTKEALLVSMIDDLDAKMKLIEEVLLETDEGTFTDRIWALNHSSFYRLKDEE
ncbi:MAG TPA: HD domain-containing protein [Bacilli bacterium]|nr:HD domain-containing protein [Bacilli bacterium]